MIPHINIAAFSGVDVQGVGVQVQISGGVLAFTQISLSWRRLRRFASGAVLRYPDRVCAVFC